MIHSPSYQENGRLNRSNSHRISLYIQGRSQHGYHELLRCVLEISVGDTHEISRSAIHQVNWVRVSPHVVAGCHNANYYGKRRNQETADGKSKSVVKFSEVGDVYGKIEDADEADCTSDTQSNQTLLNDGWPCFWDVSISLRLNENLSSTTS